MELCDEQIEAFRSQGYLNLGVLFDEEELATIAREYDRFVRKESQVLGDAEQGVFPYRAMLNFRSPELQRAVARVVRQFHTRIPPWRCKAVELARRLRACTLNSEEIYPMKTALFKITEKLLR